jgi:hypothetical protein
MKNLYRMAILALGFYEIPALLLLAGMTFPLDTLEFLWHYDRQSKKQENKNISERGIYYAKSER